MRLSFLHAFVACTATAPVFAQADMDGPRHSAAPRVGQLIEQWRERHGANWHAAVEQDTGFVGMLYGGGAAAPFEPRTDQDWIVVARHFVAEAETMHGIAQSTLRDPGKPSYLALGRVNTTDKVALVFQQEVNGVPVIDGSVSVLMTPDGRLLSVHSNAAPGANALETSPAISAAAAARAAAAAFEQQIGVAPQSVAAPELALLRVRDLGPEPQLVWRVETRHQVAGAEPDALRYAVDAATGGVIATENLVHNFDVTGTVSTNAIPGTSALNPPAEQPMRYVEVTSSAGTVLTDENGVFTYPGVNSPLDITVEYVGSFNDVRNDVGSDYSLTVQVQPNQGNDVLLNPTPTELVTSQASVYQDVNESRDYVRATTPSDSTADFSVVSNVNIASSCNAFFDGVSINFFQSGGGCENSAFSTVITHEWGHWMNVLYGTGNGSDGMGEGNADVFGMYVHDTNLLGEGFAPSGLTRDGLNTLQFCGDCCPSCHGGSTHTNGQVWMGAAWKVRRNLNLTHGDAMGDMIADSLLMGWMNGFNQTQIKSVIETQWLTLDDDDANINNGTPNYQDIDDAFREQGFPGFDLQFIEFQNVTQLSDTQDEVGPYVVQADVTAFLNPPVASATLRYRVDQGPWIDVAMANVGGDTFEAAIPGQISPAVVDYYLSGDDDQGNTSTFPDDAPTSFLALRVGVLTQVLLTDFEPAGNEGWSVGDSGDTATTGTWERGDPLGTGAQPEDDHTSAPGDQCWFTGQGSPGGTLGENDVDGGATTLKSPVFDAAGLSNTKVGYWRWYSNNTGAEPNADIFQVDLSSNGGSSWTNVETVGPGGAQSNGGWFRHEFDLAGVLTPTANMQLRFVASDNAGGSIVEAALDDIEIWDLGPVEGLGTRYCDPAVPNSSGSPGSMIVEGSSTVSDDNLVLTATNLPTNSNIGYFIMGGGTNTFVPPGSAGPICVTPGLLRLLPPVSNTNEGPGSFSRAVGTSGPQTSNITAGSTWNFQAWHRDSMAGTSNLTDAISVDFQ